MQSLCTSFKVELFRALHNFAASGGHQFKIALATGAVSLDASTTNYSALGANEVTHANYVAGGYSLTNVDSSSSGTTAMQTFSNDPTWNNVSFTAAQALIYNATQSGKAVGVLDFGGNQTVVNGTFVVNLPPVTPTTALIRLM